MGDWKSAEKEGLPPKDMDGEWYWVWQQTEDGFPPLSYVAIFSGFELADGEIHGFCYVNASGLQRSKSVTHYQHIPRPEPPKE